MDATFARYGIKCSVPPRLPGYPEPKPLYTGTDGPSTVIAEHGAWCESKCVYPANRNRIKAIMKAAA